MNLRDAIRNRFRAATVDEKEIDKRQALSTGEIFRHGTYQKRGGLRHRPFTKTPNNGESKKRRKMAAKSRKINQKA